jgi:uncharacterized membrane protein YeaQ/YmgE (transglycosylase-associated protein family)
VQRTDRGRLGADTYFEGAWDAVKEKAESLGPSATVSLGDARETRGETLGILSWVIVGGLAGLLAQYLMGEESGCLVAVLIGVIGAVIGGFVLNLFGIGGINGLSLWSIIVATIGAVILLAVFRAFKR